jgi:putative restriction endonuclease
MSMAQDIRQAAYDSLVVPQLNRSQTATVRAGDVAQALGLVQRHAAVCSAIGGRLFESEFRLKQIERIGVRASSATSYVFARDPENSILTVDHRARLAWFEDRVGQIVPWTDLSRDELRLASAPKGIYRPADWPYALSIRIIPGGPYADEELERVGAALRLKYPQEERETQPEPQKHATNLGLRNCILDQVPVGVVRRTREDPAEYEVLGLGQVVEWRDGVFYIDILQVNAGDEDTVRVDVPDVDQLPAPLSDEDARTRTLRLVHLRQGQSGFRRTLLAAYGRCCAISGCGVEAVLEAAHIQPYLGAHTNVVTNGLLLRADLHTLFDLGLLRIDPLSRRIELDAGLMATEYKALQGQALRPPNNERDRPDVSALNSAWARSVAGEKEEHSS